MPLRRAEAIVIGGHNLGEADRIIPFYTRELGMVRAVGKGVRRLRSRFGGSLEPFTHGELVYFERPNRTLHSINEFAVLEAFPRLCEDLDRLASAACAVELVAASSVEEDPNPDLFAALRRTLALLNDGVRPDLVLRAFEVKVLKVTGYLPEMNACVGCGRALGEGAGASLDAARGGLRCRDCGPRGDAGVLSPPAVAFLRAAARLDVATAATARLPEDAAEELAGALRRYLPHVLGRNLRAAAFLDRL